MAFQQPTENPIKHRFTDSDRRMLIASWKVNVKEAFNLSYLYLILHDWCVENGWGDRDDSKFPERYYLQRDNPAVGKETRLRWRFEKPGIGTKGSKLFAYALDVDFNLLGIKDTEIVWKGQKIKSDKGEFEIECSAYLIIDQGGVWEKSLFKGVKELLLQRVLKRQFLMHQKEVFTSCYRFRDFLINYFKMQPYFPEKEGSEYFLRKNLE